MLPSKYSLADGRDLSRHSEALELLADVDSRITLPRNHQSTPESERGLAAQLRLWQPDPRRRFPRLRIDGQVLHL